MGLKKQLRFLTELSQDNMKRIIDMSKEEILGNLKRIDSEIQVEKINAIKLIKSLYPQMNEEAKKLAIKILQI